MTREADFAGPCASLWTAFALQLEVACQEILPDDWICQWPVWGDRRLSDQNPAEIFNPAADFDIAVYKYCSIIIRGAVDLNLRSASFSTVSLDPPAMGDQVLTAIPVETEPETGSGHLPLNEDRIEAFSEGSHVQTSSSVQASFSTTAMHQDGAPGRDGCGLVRVSFHATALSVAFDVGLPASQLAHSMQSATVMPIKNAAPQAPLKTTALAVDFQGDSVMSPTHCPGQQGAHQHEPIRFSPFEARSQPVPPLWASQVMSLAKNHRVFYPSNLDTQSQPVPPAGASTALSTAQAPSSGEEPSYSTLVRGPSLSDSPSCAEAQLQPRDSVEVLPHAFQSPAARQQQLASLDWFSHWRTAGIVGECAQQDKFALFSTAHHLQIKPMRRGCTVNDLIETVLADIPRLRSFRLLVNRMFGLPAVQISATSWDDPPDHQALPMDFREVGGRVCTLAVEPGTSSDSLVRRIFEQCPPTRHPARDFQLRLPEATVLQAVPPSEEWPDFLAGVLGIPVLWPTPEDTALDETEDTVVMLQQALKATTQDQAALLAPATMQSSQNTDAVLPLAKPGGAPPACSAPPLIRDLQAMIASHIPLRPAWIQGPLLHMSPFEARWLADLFPEEADRRRYTVFECRLDVRSHAADSHWSLLDYITAASRSVPYPVRLVWYITRPMSGLPVPQFALTARSAGAGTRAIPIDLREMGGMIHTIELQSGPLTPIWAALRHKGVDPTSQVEQAWLEGVCVFRDEQGQLVTRWDEDQNSPEWLQLVHLEPLRQQPVAIEYLGGVAPVLRVPRPTPSTTTTVTAKLPIADGSTRAGTQFLQGTQLPPEAAFPPMVVETNLLAGTCAPADLCQGDFLHRPLCESCLFPGLGPPFAQSSHTVDHQFTVLLCGRPVTVLPATTAWTLANFFQAAFAWLGHAPRHALLITQSLPGLPEPQIVLTDQDTHPAATVVPLDLRTWGGEVVPVALQPGMHVSDVVGQLQLSWLEPPGDPLYHELFLQDTRGGVHYHIPDNLDDVQWLRLCSATAGIGPCGHTLLSSTTTTTGMQAGEQLVRFVISGGATTLQLPPVPVHTADPVEAVADLLFAMASSGRLPEGSAVTLGAAWPIRTRNERVVPFVVSGLGDHVRQIVLFDPSYDGSQLYAMGVQPGLYAEDLMSNNYRQCGLTLWVNGVHMSAVVRPLRTGDYVQLLPDRPTQASTAAHPEELLGAINRLRAFSAPLPVPPFPTNAARGPPDETRTRARAALIHAMDLATRARVEMMGLPARVSQAITLLEPGRAPHHLHLPLRLTPTLGEAEELVRDTGLVPQDYRLVDTLLDARASSVFISLPPNVPGIVYTLCDPAMFGAFHLLHLLRGVRPPMQRLPVRQGFVLALPARIDDGAHIATARPIVYAPVSRRPATTRAAPSSADSAQVSMDTATSGRATATAMSDQPPATSSLTLERPEIGEHSSALPPRAPNPNIRSEGEVSGPSTTGTSLIQISRPAARRHQIIFDNTPESARAQAIAAGHYLEDNAGKDAPNSPSDTSRIVVPTPGGRRCIQVSKTRLDKLPSSGPGCNSLTDQGPGSAPLPPPPLVEHEVSAPSLGSRARHATVEESSIQTGLTKEATFTPWLPHEGTASHTPIPISIATCLEEPGNLSTVASAAAIVDSLMRRPPWQLSLARPSARTKVAALELLDHVEWLHWECPTAPCEVFLYTDGSLIGGHFGAAFVVFTQTTAGHWSYRGFFNMQADQWVRSGLSGSHSAAMESLGIVLAQLWSLHLPRHAQIHLISDGDVSLRAAQGLCDIPRAGHDRACGLGALSRSLFLLGQAVGHQWHMHHIHGHTGQAANELVDACARQACSAPCHTVNEVNLVDALLTSSERDWFWLLPASHWHWALPSLWQLRGGTAAQLVSKEVPTSVCKHLPCRPDDARGKHGDYRIDISLSTFNAQTLRQTGATDMLAHHMSEQGCFIVGVQEARFSNTASFCLKHYQVVTSACTSQGQEGCAIFIAQGRPYGTANGKPLYLQPQHVHTIIAEPDLLLVRIRAPGLHLFCCNAHAPHAKTEEARRIGWWSRLRELFSDASLVKDGMPVLLIDSNARVGQKTSELIGSHGAEPPNDNTDLFMALLEECSFCLPATEEGHQGCTHTWTSPAGVKARLDYVAVPLTAKTAITSSWTFEVPLPREHDDHLASAVSLAFTKALPRSGRRSPILGRVPQAAPCQFESTLRGISPTVWTANLDTHAATLGKQLTAALQPLCADLKRTPREPYITQPILALVESKKEVRNLLRHAEEEAEKVVLQRYREISKLLRAALRQAKTDYLHALAAQLEQAGRTANTKWLYQALRPFRSTSSKGKRLRPLACIKTEGRPAADMEEACQIWESHFGAIEGGSTQTPSALVHQHRQAVARALPQTTFPSILDWEKQFRGLARGKAPGADGLCSEHYHSAPAAFTECTFPIALKAAVTGTEPLKWKGGIAFPLYKQKGDSSDPQNHRSILLAEMLAKRYHRWVRSSIVPVFDRERLALHAGVSGRLSTSVLSLSLRAFQARMQETRQSYGLLFLDLKSAFYSVLRDFLTGASKDDMPDRLQQLGFPSEQAEEIITTLDDFHPSSQPWGDFLGRLQGILEATWFVISGSNRVVVTGKGSRPGDPLADVLFALVAQQVLRVIESSIMQQGAAAALPLAAIIQEKAGTVHDFISCCWHDDLAVAIVADARQLEATCRSVSRVVFDAFRTRGLSPGLAKGKTEWILCPLGSHSTETKRTVLRGDRHFIHLLQEDGPPLSIGTTTTYRHLGSIISSDGSLLPEIRRRLGEAFAAGRPLRKQVFGNPRLPLHVRVTLFRSLVLSRLLHNCGAWPVLQKGEARAWQGGVLRLYKLLLTGKAGTHDAHNTAQGICTGATLPSPAQLLHLERLRLLYQLATRHCQPVLAILEAGLGSERCWLSAVNQGVQWLASVCPKFIPQPWATHPSPDEVLTWIRATGAKFLHAIQKGWGRACEQPPAQVTLLLPQPPPCPPAACPLCTFVAKNRTGLCGHLSHHHSLRSVTRRLVRGTKCPECCREFHTRQRILTHLRKQRLCLSALRAKGLLLTEAEAQELDVAEIRRIKACRGKGRQDLCPYEEGAVAIVQTVAQPTPIGALFLEDFLS